MPRRGSDGLTEEVRSAVEQRAKTSVLQAEVERIAALQSVSKAHLYRLAVKEWVERWNASNTPSAPTIPKRSGVFP